MGKPLASLWIKRRQGSEEPGNLREEREVEKGGRGETKVRKRNETQKRR